MSIVFQIIMQLISSLFKVLAFLHTTIHLPSSNTLLHSPLFPSVVSPCFFTCFHLCGTLKAHEARSICCQSFLFHLFLHYFLYACSIPAVSGCFFFSSMSPICIPPLSFYSRSLFVPIFPWVQVVEDDVLLWLSHGRRHARGRVAMELQSAGCSGK